MAAPGTRLRAPPISQHWNDVSRWEEVFRFRWNNPAEPSNIVESRTGLMAMRHLGRSQTNWDRKASLAMDNLTALSVFTKGRSGRPPLSQIVRSFSALSLAYNIIMLLRWTKSASNHADGPSRQQAIGYYCSHIDKGALADAIRRGV